jgi:hypothetical protein
MSIGVLFNDNSYLLIGVSVGDFNDRRIGNLSYIKNRLYSDLQKNFYGYYIGKVSHFSGWLLRRKRMV